MGPSRGAHATRLDAAALEALYARLETPLYNVVYRWLWDAEESQDVVQEAFVKLWAKRATVRIETVEPLIYRIAINLASNRRRSRRKRTLIALDRAAEPSTDENAEGLLLRRRRELRVRGALESLPPDLRRVIALTELSGLSYKQVGEVVGIPEGTVGSRRHKALAVLRQALREERES